MKDCFALAEKTEVLHKTTKQLLLAKISHVSNSNKRNERSDGLRNKEAFGFLLDSIRSEFATSGYSNNARLTVLQSLHKLKVYDPEILAMTAEHLKKDRFTTVSQTTNALYYLAKFKYLKGDYIDTAIEKFAREPKLDHITACRNLWNLFALDHRSDKALKLFATTILKTDATKLNELDIANALRAFAHFQYLDYECVETLLKQSIRCASEMKLHSLSVVVNSFAELEVTNPTLLAITREILLNSIDKKRDQNNMQGKHQPQELMPVDCAQFLTAYARANMFEEIDLFESLEAQFIDRIDEADGPTIVTMFCAHAAWAAHQIDECLIKKKQPPRVFKIFKKYNAAFYEKIVVNLIRNSKEINLKGVLLALVHGNVAHLKRRESMRLMHKFAVRGVEALARERVSLGGNFD